MVLFNQNYMFQGAYPTTFQLLIIKDLSIFSFQCHEYTIQCQCICFLSELLTNNERICGRSPIFHQKMEQYTSKTLLVCASVCKKVRIVGKQ